MPSCRKLSPPVCKSKSSPPPTPPKILGSSGMLHKMCQKVCICLDLPKVISTSQQTKMVLKNQH